ncbi:MAG: Ig-like domain-containing protein [Deltaproteobacteria bacterium]|nr:Ig-like domain-containing protein [Deltaproteobacteria bacterium]
MLVGLGVASFVLISACSQRKPATTPGGGAGPQIGTGGTPSGTAGNLAPPSVNAGPIFPHSKEWANPASHGVWVVQNNVTICLKCHEKGDTVAKAATAGGAPQCASCHKLFPHPADWVKKENHGKFVAENGKGNCTTQCHGVDLKGGLSGRTCSESGCHNNLYPHSTEWNIEHRAVAYNLGIIACQGCHGTDYQTILNGKNCYTCHKDFPHPDPAVWTPFTGGHGERVQITYSKRTDECEKCHGDDLQIPKGPNRQNCFSCHLSFPHEKKSAAWKEYEGHGNYVLGTGSPTREDVKNAIKECKMCHESNNNNYSGGLHNQPSCFKCHPSFPHLTDDWVMPPGQPQGHGNYVGNPSNSGTTSCATAHCHGVNLAYVTGTTRGNSCVGCHTVYPHPAGWVVPEGQPQGHGASALSAGINACKGCHSDSNGDFQRRINGHKNCYDCHEFPHPSTWTTLEPATNNAATRDNHFHGNAFIRKSLSGNTTDCTMCHGVNYDRDIAVAGLNFQCTKCHLNGVTHKDMPAWRLGTGHGKFFSDSRFQSVDTTASCWKCHGQPVGFDTQTTDAGLTAQSNCYDCHKLYPHITWSGDSWEPVDLNICGQRDATNYAHMVYVDEHHSVSSPFDSAATCGGGTNGSCHKDGLRAYKSFAIAPCDYCHRSATTPPLLPDCGVGTPPTSIQRNGPPVVVSTTPAQGATNVEPSNSIAVQFNEAMDKTSVEQTGTVTLKTMGGVNVTATVRCSQDWCRRATLTLPPSSNLLLTNITYVITVTTQAKDWGGASMAQNFQSTFSTRLPDTTPPRILRTDPVANATNVPVGRYILLYFNEPVSYSSVSNAISVAPLNGYSVTGSTSCRDINNCTAIEFKFIQPRSMSYGTTYEVVVLPNITDLAGNRFGTQPPWRFTTAP